MNSASQSRFDAVVWIVVPDDVFGSVREIESWLKEYVKDWIEVLKQGDEGQLHIKFIVLCNNACTSGEKERANIKTALSSTFGHTEVTFEENSCLRVKYADRHSAPACDLSSSCREDHQAYRLLLVDQQGRGYPCYGAWKAVLDNGSDFPDQSIMTKAYSRGNFRALCRECVNGHPNGNWDIFPCSYYGFQVRPSIWEGCTEYPHIQFTGEDAKWCRYFKPDFEISLEHSRSRLERLLFDDDFWRDAFIEDKKPLDLFWPEGKEDGSNIIPLYTTGRDRYRFNDDTPSSLDKYPATNYFLHYPHELDMKTLSDLRNRFLPICFLPHLRVLFDLTENILLLSVILTDPFTDSEFNYRSLYRDGKVVPHCFVDDSWKLIWRLASRWPKWKQIVLNLSSAIRRRRKHHATMLQEPQEYMITLSSKTFHWQSYGKENINLTGVWQCDIGNWRDRSDNLREIARQNSGHPISPSSNVFDTVFLAETRPEDQLAGKQAWQLVDGLSGKSSLYMSDDDNGWLPCFTNSISDTQKIRFGCSLLNYLIWVRAIFGDDLGAIETFNSTNLSRNKPSQFVTYTSVPLDPVARARFKLTLSILLEPVEGAYAIYSEMVSEKTRLQLEKKDAEITAKKGAIRHYGHTMGHRVSPVVAYFEHNDPATEAAACARLVHDMTVILQAYAVQSPMEFFDLNSEKNGRFVEYSKPLDLLSLLDNEIKIISAKEVQMEHGIVYRYPQYDIRAKQARIDLALEDSRTGRPCRLHTAFFTTLLSELVINAVNHGWHEPEDEDSTGTRVNVKIAIDTRYLQQRPALVLTNYYSEDVKRAPPFFEKQWRPWPQDRENDGPGMAISVFRAVQAGCMMLKVEHPIPEENEPGIVSVALLLDGLKID